MTCFILKLCPKVMVQKAMLTLVPMGHYNLNLPIAAPAAIRGLGCSEKRSFLTKSHTGRNAQVSQVWLKLAGCIGWLVVFKLILHQPEIWELRGRQHNSFFRAKLWYKPKKALLTGSSLSFPWQDLPVTMVRFQVFTFLGLSYLPFPLQWFPCREAGSQLPVLYSMQLTAPSLWGCLCHSFARY